MKVRAASGGFMDFLKENESEVGGFQVLTQDTSPQTGVSRAHLCIKSFHMGRGLGKVMLMLFIYLGEL